MLKRLKLCGCIDITGIGLNPLRGSIVLEQIDLSLARKYEHRDDVIESKISDEVVVPILNSIRSLKHVTFPKQWRGITQSLNQFRQRYNQLCNSRGTCCSKCGGGMSSNHDWTTGGHRMLQNNVCYDCLKPFCDDCTDEDGGEGSKTPTTAFWNH